ncbi:MAG: hypothetical protein HOP08_14580 [Cyclobacteriaceae bacterium]|nr:hypothetical protein [Cyclobacteriaceae bacterium]
MYTLRRILSRKPFQLIIVPLIIIFCVVACDLDENKPTPTIVDMPDHGSVGEEIHIVGYYFATSIAGNVVKFNGVEGEVTSATSSDLSVIVPAGATTGKVTITANGLTGISQPFTIYVNGNITDVSPWSGPTGTTVTVTGTNFQTLPENFNVRINYSVLEATGPNSFIAISKSAATILTSISSTEYKFNVPPMPLASGNIEVKAFGEEIYASNGQNSTSDVSRFTVQSFIVTGFTPSSGARGSSVVISGSGFTASLAAYKVYFYDAPFHITEGTVTNATTTAITVTVPVTAITGTMSLQTTDNSPGVSMHRAFIVTP